MLPDNVDGSANFGRAAFQALDAFGTTDTTAPIITGPSGGAGAASSAITVDENQTGVTQLTANETVTWSITGGTEASKFNIAADGTITFKLPPDYEVPTDTDTNNTYVLVVQATDAAGNVSTQTVTVTVRNLNDTAPSFTNTNSTGTNNAPAYSFNYPENSASGTTLGSVAAVGGTGALTYSITGGNPNQWYAINATTGAITLTAAGAASLANDYEQSPNTQTLTVTVTDGTTPVTIEVKLNETDVNDTAPVFTNTNSTGTNSAPAYSYNYPENSAAGTTLGTVSATDADSTSLTYAITGGNPNQWYAINPTTGAITLTAAGAASLANDFEQAPNTQTLTVSVSDGTNATTIEVKLNETDVNDSTPSFTNTNSTDANNAPAYSFDYPENSAAGTVLGSVAAVGGTGALTYTITGGNSNGWYAVNPTTGAITLTAAGAASVANDFEQSSNHELLTVAVSDGTTTTTIALKLNETNVNDTPPSFTNMNATGPNNAPSYSFNYAENSAAGATLGSVSAVGVTGTLTYSITGGDPNGWYAINPTTGAITLTAAGAASVANDYEAAGNAHALTVQVSDGTQAVTIDVALNETNVDDTAPLITGPSGGAGSATSGISVYEDQTAVTKVTANEAVTWSLTGGPDAAKFVIAADGTITFVAAPDYENPTDADRNNTYIVQITARDAAGNVSVQMLTVTVLNIDEITQKLNAIAPKLRTDLRNYAFGSMQDMLSFNEGLMQDAANGDCTTANRRKGVHGSIRANQNGQNVNLKMSQQLNACATRIRVYLDMGVSASSMGGNANLRSLGSIRAETQVATDVTVGLGVMGSFAADSLTSFAKSSISDESLQGNLYVRAKLSDRLRAGAFGSLGKAWYRFGLHDDGFDLSGRMTGDRYAYGAMLSGDMNLGGIKVTTDVALSRAVEKLHNATLAANYKGESRSGIGFAVGTVDATRLSVPAHVRLISRGDDKMSGRSLILTFSPGLLCEDKSADASSLTCGYQLGGKLAVATSINDRVYLDARHEDVSGNTREMISLGYAHRWGPMELGLTVDRNLSAYRADSRAMLQLRFLGR